MLFARRLGVGTEPSEQSTQKQKLLHRGRRAEWEWEELELGRPSGNRRRGPRVPSRRVWISSCRQQGAKTYFSAGKPHAWLVSIERRVDKGARKLTWEVSATRGELWSGQRGS